MRIFRGGGGVRVGGAGAIIGVPSGLWQPYLFFHNSYSHLLQGLFIISQKSLIQRGMLGTVAQVPRGRATATA